MTIFTFANASVGENATPLPKADDDGEDKFEPCAKCKNKMVCTGAGSCYEGEKSADAEKTEGELTTQTTATPTAATESSAQANSGASAEMSVDDLRASLAAEIAASVPDLPPAPAGETKEQMQARIRTEASELTKLGHLVSRITGDPKAAMSAASKAMISGTNPGAFAISMLTEMAERQDRTAITPVQTDSAHAATGEHPLEAAAKARAAEATKRSSR